jgi:hypothetical protein
VIPTEVVDQRGHGRDAAERRVGALDVVVGDPGWQGVETLLVGPVEPAVGPLGQERLDEPLRFAVGLRPIRTGPRVARGDRFDSPLEGGARVCLAVVGQDPFDADAVAGEPDSGIEQGLTRAASSLVRYMRDIGDSGGIVDDDLEVVVAETPALAVAMRGGCSSEDPVAATVGDPPSFL